MALRYLYFSTGSAGGAMYCDHQFGRGEPELDLIQGIRYVIYGHFGLAATCRAGTSVILDLQFWWGRKDSAATC